MPDTLPDLLHDHVVAAVGDRYDVGPEIGRGGAGVVYRATDVRLQRPVALKVLPPELAFRAGVRERFLREARTAAGLVHPNIVPVFAAGDDGGVAWLAMALVGGETLGARLARPPRPTPAEAARLLAEVADALAYAHTRGVVHRDIKPDNVLLDGDAPGAPGRAVVTDFGIARAAEEDARLTATGATLGTPAYMSPEQALGEQDVDGRSDQYALGVVAYQLLTGVLPFQASSATGMLMKHVGEAPRPVRERAPDVPPALAAAVERALAKRPADRWPDAAAFRDALRAGAADAAAANGRRFDLVAERDGAVPGIPARDFPRRDFPAPALPPARAVPPPVPPPGPTSRREWKEAQREWREHLKEERREQRERAREWGEYAREQARAQQHEWREAARGGLVPAPAPPLPYLGGVPNGVPPNGYPANGYPPNGFPPIPLDRRAAAFRSKAAWSLVLILFLTFINAMHLFIPPWVVFPALGIGSDLRRRWRPLGEAGLGFWDVLFNGAEAATRAGGGSGPDALAALERRVRRLRRRWKAPLAFGLLAMALLTASVATGIDALVIPFIVFSVLTVVTLVRGARDAAAVRRAGIPLSDALSDDWRAAVAAADPRPRALILADDARRLAGDAALAGPYGPAVREALEDRQAVRDTVAALAPADRALVPLGDVHPTLDGLVERVGDLARRLDQIDRDAAPGALEALDARLIAARAGASTPERERTVALLERQRASLADLAERRAALAERFESARAALRNLRLDFRKLREGGVGALGGVGSATQEARALSRDIGYALEAAAEVRER